jgi:hypothetical protein
MSWLRKRRRRELEEAKAQQVRAEHREKEAEKLGRTLRHHDEVNHLSLRVRASWLGGHQR